MATSSAVGGPLEAVKNGDWIELDIPERRLELEVPKAEIKKRLKAWRAPRPPYARGYGKMYLDHILQAHEGCDFDFLRAANEAERVPPPLRFKNPSV